MKKEKFYFLRENFKKYIKKIILTKINKNKRLSIISFIEEMLKDYKKIIFGPLKFFKAVYFELVCKYSIFLVFSKCWKHSNFKNFSYGNLHVFIHFQNLESIYLKYYICKTIWTKLHFEVSQAQYSEPAQKQIYYAVLSAK